ncbi:N-acetylneuraminate synthase family protein [Candidatus Woesearchaeota archaeon]|nr:N-acetylneuraminate synthase family protein [Candidatus Woesearchaeota archaeon]
MSEIIVEMCQNHKGDLYLLEDMINAAAQAGAKYLKMQCVRSSEVTHRPEFDNGISHGGEIRMIKRPYQPEVERLSSLDLDEGVYGLFVDKCESLDVIPMVTAFTRAQIPFLKEIGFKHIKIASYDCGSVPLLKDAKENFDFAVVSTGASYQKEIEAAAKVLEGKDYAFLHCVTIYPTPLKEIHLRRMNYLRTLTSKVGFSDHTLVERDGLKASLAALSYGADFIEKHFTILGKTETKDGPVSINPEQLKTLVDFGRLPVDQRKQKLKEYVSEEEYNLMLGQEVRELSHEELLNRAYYRGRFASKKDDGTFKYNWEE